jgi:hypothetical protein
MNDINVVSPESYGMNFIPKEFLPPGKDEFYLRNEQLGKSPNYYRQLRADEIEDLVKNDNTCRNWDDLLVVDPFSPHLIFNSHFAGLVRIGKLEDKILEHHELQVPAGITNSRVIACDIGDGCAIHNVTYLAHYIIGNGCILLNIDEMHTTNHAKFGNGVVKEGESEDVRIWIDVMNETGTRAIMPFDGMIAADAYLWAKFRNDGDLQARLREIGSKAADRRRGYYGIVGNTSVLKNNHIIKDVKIGDCCYVKGANKLKNITVNSSQAEPTQIGEGVELVNGIVGYGCHIFYGSKAVRFIIGSNCGLKYGARLIHSVLGDNSTVSCCEMLNNLIFPAHEQHHNNSFLTAAVILGQSNLAAGATIGSNHNSRANDGEVQAGRGFWPGLATTIKHSCRFASFVLLVKGDYPAELDIPFPFALVNDNRSQDTLEVMPAFWWMYNMYAIARNGWKFAARDKRATKVQHVEFDFLAPDTIEECFTAMGLLELWTAKACLRAGAEGIAGRSDDELRSIGEAKLLDAEEDMAGIEVLGERMENSRRKVLILKAAAAYRAYRRMIRFYALKNLLDWREAHSDAGLPLMHRELGGEREREWFNLGGQLVPRAKFERLVADIKSRKLDSWQNIHAKYNGFWSEYQEDKQRHAWASLLAVLKKETLTPREWNTEIDEAIETQRFISDQVRETRAKDFENYFRSTTFRNEAEKRAVVGVLEENSFVKHTREQTDTVTARFERIREP